MKKLILVRHGQTTQDKGNPDRGLSPAGIRQVKALSRRLSPLIIHPAIILHSPAHRAHQTAQILAQALFLPFQPAGLRINNINLLQPGDTRPAQAYLDLNQYGNIESPPKLVNRWLKIFNSVKHATVIAVSHEASLEAFLYHQTTLKLDHKSFRKFFGYADFASLVIY